MNLKLTFDDAGKRPGVLSSVQEDTLTERHAFVMQV